MKNYAVSNTITSKLYAGLRLKLYKFDQHGKNGLTIIR